MRKKETYLKIMVNYLLAIACVLLLIFVVPKLIGFFWPFVVAWIIAMIANPLVRFLERRVKIVRKHGSVVVIVLALAAVTGILYLTVATLAREVSSLLENLPGIYEGVEKEIDDFREQLRTNVDILPLPVRDYLDRLMESVGEAVGNSINNMDKVMSIESAGHLVMNMADGLVMGIITILSSYFFIAEKDNIANWMAKRTSKGVKDRYQMISTNFQSAIGGYFRAQLKIAVVLFFVLLVGLFLLRVDYTVLLAFLIALLDFLPIFGAGVILWPWAAYEAITGDYLQAVLLMVLYVVCMIVRQVIQPKMVADSIGLNPLATMFFMFIGYRFGRILGMIVAIPVGMVVMNFHRIGLFDDLIRGAQIVVDDVKDFRKF